MNTFIDDNKLLKEKRSLWRKYYKLKEMYAAAAPDKKKFYAGLINEYERLLGINKIKYVVVDD